jgi:hypothetical protein
MALQADLRIGDPSQGLATAQGGSYVKIVSAEKVIKRFYNQGTKQTVVSDPYLIYSCAVYPNENTRRADTTAGLAQRQSCPYVDRFKIMPYTGTDEDAYLSDAYTNLKTQTAVVANTRDLL